MPDLERLAGFVEESIAELRKLAAETAPGAPASRAGRNGSSGRPARLASPTLGVRLRKSLLPGRAGR